MKADRKLEELGAEFEKIEQDNPTLECSDAAEERGMETSQIVKSLIVRKNGELYHLCLPGDREVSEGKFGDYRLVEKEKSKEITGQKSGTVHPFSSDLPHVVDEHVFENKKVSFTAGTETEAVKIKSESLEEALEKADFEFEKEDIVVSDDKDLEQLKNTGLKSQDVRFVAENGYRTNVLELAEEFSAEKIVDTIREFERNEIEVENKELEAIIEESDNQTHMQKMVENFAETGEINSGGEFNLEEEVEDVIADNPEAVEDYSSGTDSAMNYLLGQVMQKTNGKADGEKTKKILEAKM